MSARSSLRPDLSRARPLVVRAAGGFGTSILAGVAIDRLVNDPGALILAAEMAIGAALPWLLLRPGERLPGYAATASLTVVTAAAIGPVTSFIRAVSDRF